MRANGFVIDREDPRDLPLVVATETSRRIPAPEASGVRWIWLAAGRPTERQTIDAALRGAYDVISATDSAVTERLIARLRELSVPDQVPPRVDHIVTASAVSQAVVTQAWRVAQTSMSVLLTGETGTGKEVISRLIHAWSPRGPRPFIPINCAAIPNDLMEAELFGYARGAFSGAVQAYEGQLAAAEGGTVFLDEIDDTPLETQVKLLRVLEDHVVSRLGENIWRQVDFRLLAATNRDLEPLVAEGRFGADLYALCFDPDPKVIQAVLQNARVGLAHARFIATWHSTSAGLEYIGTRNEFFRDSGVQRRLLRNTHLSESFLKRIIQPKRLGEIFKACMDKDVPQLTRTRSRGILRQKFTGMAQPEERTELIVQTEGRCLPLLVGCTFDGRTTQMLCSRQYNSMIFVQNLAKFPATPPTLLAHLIKQPSVRRNQGIKRMLLQHKNMPSEAKKYG